MIYTNFQDILINSSKIGQNMYTLAESLYPLCRSITGNGVRETLKQIGQHIPIVVHEVPTGTQVFDWTVPREWNIRDAYIKNEQNERLVDFKESNLHVVSYSTPVHEKIFLDELKKHLFTLPDHPEWIPYRTSYYKETWGFCISQNQLSQLKDETYEVYIDSSLQDGFLSYGEYLLKGDTEEEILLSAHICHPSLANDNLSGIVLLTYLAKYIRQINHKYTYRFLFAPGTIGSITWLSHNERIISRIKHGLVIACVGDDGGPTYKRSRQGDAEIDKAVQHVLKHYSKQPIIENFSPYGYDERQFCSPGFDLPVGLFERSKYGQFPQYHTSADDLNYIKSKHLSESFEMIIRILDVLEGNKYYFNLNPKCEPQLGNRGLYDTIGADKDRARKQIAILWVLNQSDGAKSLLDIADRADIPFNVIHDTALLLEQKGLLQRYTKVTDK